MRNGLPYFPQHDANDCGPACLKMVSTFYGKNYTLNELREYCYINAGGVSLLGIAEGAEKIGFHTLMLKTDYEKLLKDVPLPSILHWNQEHFVVLYDRTVQGLFKKEIKFKIADPANSLGINNIDETTFRKNWISDADDKGVLLVLYPTDNFYDGNNGKDKDAQRNNIYSAFYPFLKPYRKQFFSLFLGMLLASVFALIFPFLNQYLLDIGVYMKNRNILIMLLLAQLSIFLGSTIIDITRNVLYLHISNRISIRLVSDYLNRLMRLPVSFFEIRSTGDINQRIQDHDKIETFLTNTSINTIFSIFNIIMFSVVLFVYNTTIFCTYLLLSLLSVGWIILFQHKRRRINYKKFQALKVSQDNLLEIIGGIKEIKLNNSETIRRWRWERNQIKKYKINVEYLTIEQWQKTGFDFINQFKNILIIYIAANLVMADKLTVGAMLSVLYVVGQINNPLQQLTDFFKLFQDARISFERRSDILNIQAEEQEEAEEQGSEASLESGDIHINNLYFQYSSPKSSYVLKSLNLTIPRNKVTAIVGPSGCGKTTLLKLLLKFYTPVQGEIKVGDEYLSNISDRLWRSKCGAVMQDGYIFGDTIARNIVTDGSPINRTLINRAVEIANIKDFINSQPLRYTTKLGMNGYGLSAGQKQRLLIARAVYKNPDYLFFDEATSALDAKNERTIIENLNAFYKGKTVVVVAHRLSTVKNADQIIVMNNGEIVETGTHIELIKKQAFYYDLVKNQLELGM
ncbi:MAG TPA: peptidase domain-containing ABC transporter [Chitinophaga sp.]|uniref:peptidase domain-containing ABC transporter n=1 Tax=Chitinophaga sp. TaxID=1869181 RepID=UPI002D0F7539|nr:peptidase domain-containing ABC transporter [Chitinophaga sp.]HVI48709.1 peptidase domain-containing ABC transporter [Chitinophaga sp.]